MASSVYQNTGPPGRPPAPPPPGSHRQPPYASSQQYSRNQGPPPPLPQQQQAPPPPPPPPAQQPASYPPPPGVSYPPPPPPGTSGPSTSGYGHHYPAPPPPSHYQQRYAPRQPPSSSYPASGYPQPPSTYPASSSSQPTSQFHAPGRPSSWSSGSSNAGPAPPSSRPFPPSNSQPQVKQGGHRETEEERRERKRREYEMKKQRDSKSSQNQPVRSDKKSAAAAAAAAAAADRTENRLKRNSTFLCKIKFRNELPDPVSQPKLLRIYNDKDRYSKYSITSLEKTYKHRIHWEPDLGIPLDLLDLSVYNPPKTVPSLDPADAELLVDDEVGVKQKDNSRRKERPTDKGVAWLVKTTYISPVSADPAKPSLTEKQAKEQKEVVESINDREQQIQAIEESFRVFKLPPVHQTKPELKPVEIWPLLPDFDRAGDKFVHLCFDTEPTGESEIYSKLDRGVRDYFESRAIMKSYTIQREGSKPEKFLAYMVPKPDEADYDEEDGVPYNWIREYNWDAPGDARSNYVFCFGEDAVRYLPLDARLTLHKKKAREGRSKDDADNSFLVPSSVTVRRRELSEEEEEQRDTTRRNFMEGQPGSMQEDSGAAAGHSNKRKRTGDNERQAAPRHRRSYSDEDREMSDENEFI